MTNKHDRKLEDEFYHELDEKGRYTSNVSLSLIVIIIVIVLIFAIWFVAMI